MESVAMQLYNAKREAGNWAVRAAEAQDYELLRKWQRLCQEIDDLAFRTLDLTRETIVLPRGGEPCAGTISTGR